MIDDAELIARMVWHPIHFKGLELSTSAFEEGDLIPEDDEHGFPRYMSTDKVLEIQQNCIDWRVAFQQRDGRAERLDRKSPKFVEFNCGGLRALLDTTNVPIFGIISIPVAAGEDGEGSPPNPAHCGVKSTSGAPAHRKEKRAKVAELRTQLLKSVIRIVSYETMFPTA